MASINIKCKKCDAEIYLDDSIDSIICGCCMTKIDIAKERDSVHSQVPIEFIVKNGVLKKYIGEASAGIRVPEGVKTVGRYAFEKGILSVYLPDGVEKLEAGAFHYCPYLMYLRLPDTITTVENTHSSYGDTWAINYDAMTRSNPIKPIIECSSSVKELLLADYPDAKAKKIEEVIEWK